MKTPAEVQALKENWEKDPCWDIETTEGFEEYRDDLLFFSNRMMKIWNSEFEAARRIERERGFRKVTYIIYENGKHEQRTGGLFHQWGLQADADSPTSWSVAIVENQSGIIFLVHPEHITFEDGK